MLQRAPPPSGSGLDFSLSFRTKLVLGILISAYLLQIALTPLLEGLLPLRPLGAGFMPWQLFGYPLVQGSPFAAVLGWVVLFFFLDTTVGALGERRFWFGTLTVWAVSTALTLLVGLTGILVPTSVSGFTFWFEAMIVWFGFTYTGATIRYMMVLPLPAPLLAWLSGVVLLLSLAYYRDLASAHGVIAWLTAYAWLKLDSGILRRLQLRWRKRQIERQLGRFSVHDGGKAGEPPRAGERPRRDPKDWVN